MLKVTLFGIFLIFSSCYLSIKANSGEVETYDLCVDNTNGQDDTLCLNDINHCCKTLNYTLNWISSQPHSTVIVHIQHPGVYVLEGNYSINYMDGFSLIAAVGGVNITCTNKEGGLSFIHTSNINIKGITLYKCGAIQNSTNYDIYSNNKTTIKYHVVFYFVFCSNVKLSNINFNNTQGISVALYNTVGTVTIDSCMFFSATQHDRNNNGGGGGLQIEFSYCPPGSHCMDDALIPNEYSSNSNYTITNTTFESNQAWRGKGFLYKFTNRDCQSYNLGNGAGLSLVLKGKANNNHFMLSNCTFDNNWAHYGGGFYFGFFDNSHNNTIMLINVNVTNNKNYDATLKSAHWDIDATGGGGAIIYQSGKEGRNKVIIRDSIFVNNTGNSGGALSAQGVTKYSHIINGSLDIVNVNFTGNHAYMGSAIYFFQDNLFNQRNYNPYINITLKDLQFIDNIPLCFVPNSRHVASLPCTAIIFTSNQLFTLRGLVNFTSNEGSAIEVHFTEVIVYPNTNLIFDTNQADHGAGIALYDCSFIKIYYNTTFLFKNNKAISGAAIYSAHCTSGESQTASLSTSCFLTYYNFSVYPNNWNTSFKFINNKNFDNKTSVMYIRSLVSCYWPKQDEHDVHINTTFCHWKPFNFTQNGNNCTQAIQSDISYISYRDIDVLPIYPGQTIPIPLVYDGRNVSLTQNIKFKACILEDFSSHNDVGLLNEGCKPGSNNYDCATFSTSNPYSLYYCPNKTFGQRKGIDGSYSYVSIEASANSKIRIVVKINFTDCQWPYTFNKSYCLLTKITEFCCSNTSLCDSGLSCPINSLLRPKLAFCISKFDKFTSNDYIIGRCPISYANLNYTFKYTSLIHEQTNITFCNNSRTGQLCGRCQEGTSIVLSAIYYKCVEDCNSNYEIKKGWIYLIGLQFIPQTILVLLIVLLNIKLSVGIVSGFILYCQIMSLQVPGWYYPPFLALSDGTHVGNNGASFYATSTYSLFNMRFLTFFRFDWKWNVCITHNLSMLGAISFFYIVAFYPLLLLLLIGLWLALYDRGILTVVRLTVPLHRCLARFWRYFQIEPSLINSCVSIYILSVMELISISLKILHYTSWQSIINEGVHGKSFFYDANLTYFGWPHAIFGLFAFVIITFLVCIPTCFLLFYKFSWFNRLLFYFKIRYQWCVMVGDVMGAPFKDGSKNRVDFSYVAGLYILFRGAIMSFYYIVNTRFILIAEISLSCLYAAFIMIFRPFKSTLINFAEFIIFFNLGLMAALCLAFQSVGRLACIYGVMHIPTILVLALIANSIYKRVRKYYEARKRRPVLIDIDSQTNDDESDIEEFRVPDRVLNPGQYQEKHVAFTPSISENDEVSLPSLTNSYTTNSNSNTSRTQFVQSLRSSIRNTDSDYGTKEYSINNNN